MKFPLIQAKRRLWAKGKGQGRLVIMGAGPHTPIYEKMGEHSPPDWLAPGFMRRVGRFYHPINRAPRFIGGNHIKKQSQFLEVRSIILHINNKICFSKIRLSSKNTATTFFAKLCYNWKQSFRRRSRCRPPPVRQQAERAGCADDLPGRQAQPVRACTFWQIGRQRRVGSWQVPLF